MPRAVSLEIWFGKKDLLQNTFIKRTDRVSQNGLPYLPFILWLIYEGKPKLSSVYRI